MKHSVFPVKSDGDSSYSIDQSSSFILASSFISAEHSFANTFSVFKGSVSELFITLEGREHSLH